MVCVSCSCLGADLTLIWDPSTDPRVTGYNIYYGVATRDYRTQRSVGAVTTVTIHDLVPGGTYYFAATSHDAVGMEGAFTPEIAFTVPYPPPPELPSQQDRVIAELATLRVTNTATGSTPSNLLEYQLVDAPSGAQISSDGIITWTPTAAQAPGTNLLMTVVTENGIPVQRATNAFTVVVTNAYPGVNLADPTQTQAGWEGNGFSDLAQFALGTDLTAGLSIYLTPTDDGQHLILRFKQRLDAPAIALEYVPEVSDDGQTWYSDSAHVRWVSEVPFDAEFNEVTVRDLTPVTPGGVRFIRLRIVER